MKKSTKNTFKNTFETLGKSMSSVKNFASNIK